MPDGGFAYSHLFAKDLPPPAPRWTGFPKYNFIGGHNDPVRIPAAALAEAAATVLQRHGADLALYNFDGPQGYHGLRQFVVDKLAQRPAIECSVDDVLITSGSGQARLPRTPQNCTVMRDVGFQRAPRTSAIGGSDGAPSPITTLEPPYPCVIFFQPEIDSLGA